MTQGQAKVERREATRVRADRFGECSVTIRPLGSAWVPVMGILVDISQKGAGVRLPIGSLGAFLPRKVHLGVEMGADEHSWEAEARVRRYQDDEAGILIGIQFTSQELEVREALRRFVDQQAM